MPSNRGTVTRKVCNVSGSLNPGRTCRSEWNVRSISPDPTSSTSASATVARNARVTSVKQSGAEWTYHHELIALGRELGFAVLTGSDTRLDEALALGCTGCISGLSNVCGELLVEVCKTVPAGDTARTAQLMSWLKRVGAACGKVHFPMDVAAGMRARGLNPGAPKQIVSKATEAGMAAVTAELIPVLREAGLIA